MLSSAVTPKHWLDGKPSLSPFMPLSWHRCFNVSFSTSPYHLYLESLVPWRKPNFITFYKKSFLFAFRNGRVFSFTNLWVFLNILAIWLSKEVSPWTSAVPTWPTWFSFMTSYQVNSFLSRLVTNCTCKQSHFQPWSDMADSCETQHRLFRPFIVAKT